MRERVALGAFGAYVLSAMGCNFLPPWTSGRSMTAPKCARLARARSLLYHGRPNGRDA
jgi:hypothetical protein